MPGAAFHVPHESDDLAGGVGGVRLDQQVRAVEDDRRESRYVPRDLRETASADESRLLEWELILPSAAEVTAAARSLRDNGHIVDERGNGVVAADPWGTRVHLAPVA